MCRRRTHLYKCKHSSALLVCQQCALVTRRDSTWRGVQWWHGLACSRRKERKRCPHRANRSHGTLWRAAVSLGALAARTTVTKSKDNFGVGSISYQNTYITNFEVIHTTTDYGRQERKKPSLHGRKFTPTPKFLGTAEAYFVCHIGPNFQISLIYAFIGCP